MSLYPRVHARYARAHTQGSPAEVYSTLRTICGGPLQQEDINDATHQNASSRIHHGRRVRDSNPCPAARGTCWGSGIYRYRGAGGRCPCACCGRSSTSCRLSRPACGRSRTSSGVWRSTRAGWGLLRALLSALATSSTLLAPVVILLSFPSALPCRAYREGLFLFLLGVIHRRFID